MGPRLRRVGLGAACLLGLQVSTEAHHSQAMFETEQMTLRGTITRFQYTAPHIHVFLDIDMDGRRLPFRLEGSSPRALREFGWGAKILAAGEKVTVTFSKSRDGSNFGLLRSLTKADGTVLPAAGEPSEEATETPRTQS